MHIQSISSAEDIGRVTKLPLVDDALKETIRSGRMLPHLLKSLIFIAEKNGHIVGIISATERLSAEHNGIFLGQITVDPKAREQKIGSALMGMFTEYADKKQKVASLYVDVSNPAALALHTKFGFVSTSKITLDSAKYIHMTRPCTAGLG